jgi:Ser-tRNA(Ala) deacylase AlaX
MKIDAEFRRVNARIHSAGHLLDVAMNRAGRTDLKPGKGYHFEAGPYVEYIGVVEEKDRPALKDTLTKHCADLIKEA